MSESVQQARYEYKPLPSNRSIRLIRFQEGDTPICRIFTVEVEKAPPYAALSYTWGNKELSRTILVDGCEMPVTVNLAEAIDAIFAFARNQYLMFWADSICINQADVHERGRQVALMSTIYRSAEIVAIWLGPAADNNDLAFDQMYRWKASLDVFNQEFGGSNALAVASISYDNRFFVGLPGSQEFEALEALRMLCRRPWWRRAWIVQEGTVARPERTRLFCGDRSTDWLQLRSALLLMSHIIQISGSHLSVDENISMDFDIFREHREAGKKIYLLDALRLTRARECEDPRDKVYAAMGMAMDVNEEDIIPDYTRSHQSLFMEVVEFYMSKDTRHVLDVIDGACKLARSTTLEHDRDNALPSWVPDWTCPEQVKPFEKELSAYTYESSECAYNASLECLGYWKIIHDELHIQGSFLDRISSVSSVCQLGLASGMLNTWRSWRPDGPERPYLTGQTMLEAFNHTLTADIGRRSHLDLFKLSRGVAVDWMILDKKGNMTAEMTERYRFMFDDIKVATMGRRLIETSKGFIGLAPAAAQVGDDICVFLGGQVLYVVRPRGDGRYEYIGESYVHGMMDGRACDEEYFTLRDFVLR